MGAGPPPPPSSRGRATGRGPMSELSKDQRGTPRGLGRAPGPSERERERESSTCHERSGRTSPKQAIKDGPAGVLSYAPVRCPSIGTLAEPTRLTSLSLSLFLAFGSGSARRLSTGLGPRSFLARVPCSLSLFHLCPPPKLERLLKSGSAGRSRCGRGWALGPSSLAFPACLSLSLPSLSHRPPIPAVDGAGPSVLPP